MAATSLSNEIVYSSSFFIRRMLRLFFVYIFLLIIVLLSLQGLLIYLLPFLLLLRRHKFYSSSSCICALCRDPVDGILSESGIVQPTQASAVRRLLLQKSAEQSGEWLTLPRCLQWCGT